MSIKNCISCERPARCMLAGLPETELSATSEMMQSLYYQRGQSIWRAGICRPGSFILCEGDAILLVRGSAETKHRIVKILREGDLISCVDGSHLGEPIDDFIVQVEATSPVLVRHLPAESFRSLLMRCPSIATKVMESLSDLVMDLLHELWVSSSLGSRSRVAQALIRLQEAAQLERRHLSQQFLAEMSGVSRRTVNKKLHRLVQEKIIVMGNHRIRIVDERRLMSLLRLCFIGLQMTSLGFD